MACLMGFFRVVFFVFIFVLDGDFCSLFLFGWLVGRFWVGRFWLDFRVKLIGWGLFVWGFLVVYIYVSLCVFIDGYRVLEL